MKIKNVLLSTAAATASLLTIGATASAATVTVKAGDTVSQIALDNNTTVDAIQQANHLNNVNLIFVGQQLQIGDNTTTQTTSQPAAATTTQTSQSTQTQTQTKSYSAPAATQSSSTTTSSTTNYDSSNSAAKAWIANKESGGSYTARNGQYIGKYQLTASYLNGDYSAANQERVADSYVASRYGSWNAAKAHWLANNWY